MEAEIARLREELRLRDAAAESNGAGAGREAGSGGTAAQPRGGFTFPRADLPWPLEYLRVVGPGESPKREAFGDWLSLFRNAAPYIAAFRGGTAVVHVPSFMLQEQERDNFKGLMEDVAFCSLLGLNCVVVTSVEDSLLQRLREKGGYEERPGRKVGNDLPGIRLDEKALEIVKQEAGLARVEVESALSAGFEKRTLGTAGGNGTPTSAGIFQMRGAVSVVSSTNFFSASPMGVLNGVDYGYAGIVRSVNTEALGKRLESGDIVSLTPIGASPSGEVFFVSSEALAATVAQKLRAIKLVYITRGQRLIDTRDGSILAGMQVHDAKALHQYLEGEGAAAYPEEVRTSRWFADISRQLRLLCSAVSEKGVRRGHLVDPYPGALLQEFYTTDGSGTCVAQDLYQGLGQASASDAPAIRALLIEDAAGRGLGPDDEAAAVPTLEGLEAGCAAGEFFVWKRDEVVLGCGQLVPVGRAPAFVAGELRCLAVSGGQHDTQLLAMFAYAERVALEGGACFLVAPTRGYAAEWLHQRGFREPSLEESACFDGLFSTSQVPWVLKPLGEAADSESKAAIAAFSEEMRKWGALQS